MTTETRPTPSAAVVSGRRRWAIAGAASATVATAVAVAAWYGGGLEVEQLPGLPVRSEATGWFLAAGRAFSTVAAVCTVGLLLAAAVLSPRREGELSPTAYRRLRAASWAATAWVAATVAVGWFTLNDLFGAPPTDVPSMAAINSFLTSLPNGRALILTAVAAVAVAVVCRVTLTPAGAAIGLCIALFGVVPPVFTGHAATAGNHQLAVSALLLHVVPVTVWVGGLGALLLAGRQRGPDLAVAVRRFSMLAGWCVAAVAVSGLLSAWVRLGTLSALTGSRYGHLVLVKTALLAGVAVAGGWQRRRALPALERGDASVFRRIATVEVLLFAATMGVASALSRTPPPDSGAEEDAATSLLGYPMPAPLTAGRLLGAWLPEPILLTAAVVAVGLYVTGWWRLRRRGDTWPVHRVLVWSGGWLVVVVATSSGLARYAPVLFSVHMVQHLMLTMVAPILLVLASPLTLALRAVPAANPDWPGPREWILQVVHSGPARWLTHPAVALALYVGSLYAMYFTGLYELALRSHAAHLAMVLHFLGVGYLFFWVIVGTDPAPRRVPYPVRMLVLVVAMVFHAILGVALMQSGVPVAADWFAQLDRPWGPSAVDDQRTAGGIAWSFGEAPTLLVLLALFAQWARADEREQRRIDRAADRATEDGSDDELAAYNRMLAELARRDASRADR